MNPEDIEISFCTTCAGRAYQLKKTLVVNAPIIAADPALEWVIVNFNSKDDLHEHMMALLPSLSRRIVYVRESTAHAWHASIAKNLAHRQASGRILMNLDGDNFISDAVGTIRTYFGNGCRMLHMWSNMGQDGTGGRIALSRELFYELGGYDETFYPMGYQDIDLLIRASTLGVPVLKSPCAAALTVPNDKRDSIINCKTDGMVWEDYNRRNREQSIQNIKTGKLTANSGTAWAASRIETWRGMLA